MSKLKPQYQLFAEGVAQGMSGPDAVNHAGYKSKGSAARNQAVRLMANDGVAKEIERLREKSSSAAVWSAKEIKEGLTRMLKVAESESDFTGFSGLSDRLCKMEGHYEKEVVEHTGVVRVVIGGEDE